MVDVTQDFDLAYGQGHQMKGQDLFIILNFGAFATATTLIIKQ